MDKIAVFIDLNKSGFNFNVFKDVMAKLDTRGQIIYGKLYNFSSSKHKTFLDYINKRDIATCSQSEETLGKRNKDVLDIRQVVDILNFVNSGTKIDTILLITGKGNVVPLIKSLKIKNLYVIGAFDYLQKSNMDMCSENYNLSIPTIAVKEESKKKTKKKTSAKTTAKKSAKKTVKKTASSKVKKATVKKVLPKQQSTNPLNIKTEVIETQNNDGLAEHKNINTENKTTPLKQNSETIINQNSSKNELNNQLNSNSETQELENSKPEEKKKPKTEEIEKKKEEPVSTLTKKTNFETEEQYFIRVLEGFAKRTSNLNFEFNEDLDEKKLLLSDIEKFVAEQKVIQYEKDDFNPNIMAVLRELGNLATDIKATMDLDDDDDGNDEFNY